MKVTKKVLHERLINDLVSRLTVAGRYDNIITDYEYCEWSRRRTIDVLAHDNKTYHFYKVDYEHSKRGLLTANEEYKDFCRAHPGARTKGIYYNKRRTTRIRLGDDNQW